MRNNFNFYDIRVGFDYYFKLLNVVEVICLMWLLRLLILKLRFGFGFEVIILLCFVVIIFIFLYI